jgi:DUF1365 family protein
MLTIPRCLGVAFNPVTFYYCHDEAGQPDAVVAEITNTPWNERHRYVVALRADGRLAARFGKQFHVSPFQPMEQTYEWWFSTPGDLLLVRMRNVEDDHAVFDAGLTMERRPWTAGELAKTLARHPFMSAKVLFGIYLQALRARLAGATFHPHPDRAAAEAGL